MGADRVAVEVAVDEELLGVHCPQKLEQLVEVGRRARPRILEVSRCEPPGGPVVREAAGTRDVNRWGRV
jgi:hypothetical protein